TVPDVARTVRVPLETAVTSPVATPEVTAVTTVESPTTDQVTVGFEIGSPAAFFTVAVMVCVAPIAVSVWAVDGESVIDAAAFETVTVMKSVIAALTEFVAWTFVVPGALAMIIPSDVTRAMSGSSLVQVAADRASVAP